jgi:hypothetical protein
MKILFFPLLNNCVMAKTSATRKRGPKDRSYVNQTQKHEVKYESKRKTPAKKFGASKAK